MQNTILFDDETREQLLPLTYTRPVSELRVGILTIREKWEALLRQPVGQYSAPHLNELYNGHLQGDNLLINGSILPTAALVREISALEKGDMLLKEELPIALRLDERTAKVLFKGDFPDDLNVIETEQSFLRLEHLWQIFRFNGMAIQADVELLTKGKESQSLSATNTLIGDPKLLFIEEGAKIEGATLNTSDGPIYVGANAEIMEGCLVRGPFALCAHGILKMGAKIYGPTTVGPYSKVGGEVNNSVFQGFSNKGHDGFLGNSVIGEWCNIGADSNTSNLKNNYAEVRLWDYTEDRFAPTGQQFCGLIMGDHSKCGINTMFNTGTVIGVSANIFGSGFPRNFVPSFAWGGAKGFNTYRLEKVYEVAEMVMQRRNKMLTNKIKRMLEAVYEQSSKYRKWE